MLLTTSVQKGIARILGTLSESDVNTAEDSDFIGNQFFRKLFSENLEELSSLLPEAAYEISNRWDELTEILVNGCLEPLEDGTVPVVDFEELTLEDITNLRNAINEINDWQKIWNTEKNSVVDMFGGIIKGSISTGQKNESNQDGGQSGKQSSLVQDIVSQI